MTNLIGWITLSVAFVTPNAIAQSVINAQIVNGSYNASQYSGADIGAQVNTAFAAAGTSTTPTIYIPRGAYSFSTTMALTSAIKLECEPGTVLNYAGTGAAVALGTSALASLTATQIGSAPYSNPYEITGCTFTGGLNMSYGIFANYGVVKIKIHGNQFQNFGNGSAYDIWLQGNNWDVRVEDNYAWADMDQPSFAFNFLMTYAANSSGAENSDGGNTHLYFLRNHIQNSAPHAAGAGLVISGLNTVVKENNISMMVPNVLITGSLPSVDSAGTIIADNYFETGGNWGSFRESSPCVQYGPVTGANYVSGITIERNYCNLHNTDFGSSSAFLAPSTASTGLQYCVISRNTIEGMATGTVLVVQNNNSWQLGNVGNDNIALIGSGGSTPIALPSGAMHTSGTNISSWTGDNGG